MVTLVHTGGRYGRKAEWKSCVPAAVHPAADQLEECNQCRISVFVPRRIGRSARSFESEREIPYAFRRASLTPAGSGAAEVKWCGEHKRLFGKGMTLALRCWHYLHGADAQAGCIYMKSSNWAPEPVQRSVRTDGEDSVCWSWARLTVRVPLMPDVC